MKSRLQNIPIEETLTITQHSSRVSLHDEEALWILEKGSIDLFAIEKVNGKPEGQHHFINEFIEGSLLFGFPHSNEHEMTAIAEPGAVLHKISREKLSAHLQEDPSTLQAFLPLFNRWVGTLPNLFIQYQKEKEVHLFLPSQADNFVLHEGEKVMAEHLIGGDETYLISWVKLEKGDLSLLGCKDVCITSPTYLPLRSELWWQALSETRISEVDGVAIIKKNIWTQALEQFHLWYLKALSAHWEKQSQREKELVLRRAYLEEKGLSDSFNALSSVLRKEEAISETREDALLLACQLIGKEIDVHFIEPTEGICSVNIMPRIHEICDASDVRFRQVSLSGNWFKEDCGYLLGFFGPYNKPVALVSNDRGEYVMIDPHTQERTKIDSKLAVNLSNIAFEFYAPFENEKLNWKQFIKFSLSKKGKKIGLALIIGVGISLLNLFLPFGSKIIFGKAIPELNKNLLWQAGGALFLAAISSGLYQLSQGFLIFRITSLAGNRMEGALWDRLLKLPVRFFKRYAVGDLYERINGFVTARRAFNNYYILLILTALFSVFYLIAMCIFSLTLTLIGVSIIGLSLVVFYYCLVHTVRLQRASYEIKGRLNGFIVQVIAGISKLRVTGGEKRAFSHWAKRYAEAKKNDLKSQYYNTAIETTFSIMPTLSALFIFSTVIYFVFQTQENPEQMQQFISAGDFFGFVTAFGAFSGAIFGAIPAITYLYRVMQPIWMRGKVIIETEPEVDALKRRMSTLTGHVAIDQVFFRYDKRTPHVLKNVTLKALPGEFIGIVGPSGCGKSTLFRLLLGFEMPEKGTVTYDGVDLAHLDLRTVRRQLGVVLQHGSILAGTIHENLVCGGIYSKEQVDRAIHLSGFGQDLWNFPMGLHTVLSSGGGTLSGGQKQRLLIARALISDPKILLFDEATSALDNTMQERLSKNIEKLNVTRIVIAHRLSTLRHSDRIYVIDQGEVLDHGTFDELAARPGLFSELISRQKI